MSGKSLPFPGGNNVPIVGEPCAVASFTAIFLVICKNCTPYQPVLVPGLAPTVAVCPTCRRGFQILGVQHNVQSGQIPQFQVNIILPQGDAAAEGLTPPAPPS